MKTLIFTSNTRALEVLKNEDGTLKLLLEDGSIYANAGSLIYNLGGIEKFLERCTEIETSLSNFLIKKKAEFDIWHAEKKLAHEQFKATQETKQAENWNELSSLEIIPATHENIRIVLKYLHTQNWGGWELPRMALSYSAAQYDCDGVTATTMKFDKKIDGISKFKVGGKFGHLNQYTNRF